MLPGPFTDVPAAGTTVISPAGAQAPVIAALVGAGPALVVSPSGVRADELAAEWSVWAPGTRVAVYPAWETLPHERLSPSPDIVATRLRVWDLLRQGAVDVVVAPVRALMQPVAAEVLARPPVMLEPGHDVEPGGLATDLVEYGYERVDLVERRGHFAIRGGIIDVFPPTADHPVRAELWGDTIEELRWFSVADQRSLEPAGSAVALYPCREMLLDHAIRRRAEALAARHPAAGADLAQIAAGIAVPGMESFSPLLSDDLRTLDDALPGGATVVLVEEDRIAVRADEAIRTAEEFAAAAWSAASLGADSPLTIGTGVFVGWPALRERLGARPITLVTPLRLPTSANVWDPGLAPIGPFPGSTAALEEIARRADEGWTVSVVAAGSGTRERLREVLNEREVATAADDEAAASPGVVAVTSGRLATGFEYPARRYAVYADADLSRRTASRTGGTPRMPSRRRNQVDPLSLRAGDFVVHEKHGVGRYLELIHKNVRGIDREFLVVEYAPSKRGHPPDRLSIPTDQLQAVSRYVGGEQPKVNKLGGSDWARAKGRARKAVKEIAAELVRLYAARQAAAGFAFSPDTPWQSELEGAFEYVETADQMAAIDEVKADMERPVPMDRLICGDVGYGKTEIAVRAAFKAVQDGKQVAVLVPTTLLVQQHLQTFTDRFEGFPVRVAALSRFLSDTQAKDVVERLATGSIDVVIGTHRLLTTTVRFKDLGLVIVDEEQRFGVEHKEHLKALRANVDVLSMSATPIPRTLEMAVTGIREMSTIATPPEDRLPILTYVGPYDNKQIAAAVHRELLRDGQVFFVHNRVQTISRKAAELSDLVPEARIAVAHGQMPEHQLEQVVVDFWEGRVDVLVCSTIVESGIDIANANTLIVDRADAFGLSQLHQLRGRVGRSRSRAYAYFLHAADRAVTETAHERLSTIAQNTDLGSGMQVALKDLEIRGAGNLLGGEQSGHIAEVGFDLYIRLVGEALSEFKGEGGAEQAELRIDLPVDAFIPAEYVPEERLRLEAYRRLAAAETGALIDDLAAELADRYGVPPESVTNMIAVARFRLVAMAARLDEVLLMGSRVRMHPVELPESRRVRLARLYPGSIVKPATRQILVPFPAGTTGTAALDWTGQLVKTVLGGEAVADGSPT